MFSILQEEEIIVNSRHRYKVMEVGGLFISAYSKDGVIESIEKTENKFAIGI